ncbi:MAG: insulinase family protein [Acidobacteria bacterium]|nr:MAG: insulinase family protein [Acidobacteriota bacterium]
MPQIQFTDRKLPNGLRVISAPDHSSPTVAIQVWYHVGSKDDPNQRSGFAHLFEHMMFKSTRNMKSEMMDRLTEDVGGFNNAFTADDVTVYYEVVPSNYLETLLWAEADRLSALNVDDGNFKSERDVVKEEFRQTVLSPPYGRFEFLLQQKSFVAHPYKRPGIGSMEDLDAALLNDVREFHSTYYRPDNATLVVVGDFDPEQLDAWVDKYFGPLTKPDRLLPRVQIKEPARKGEVRFTEYGTNDLPAVGLTFLTPAQSHPDSYPLEIAQAILGVGASSRLYNALVYQQQLVAEVTATTDSREDVSLFLITAVLSEGKKPADVERSLLAEIKKLQDTPVSLAELNKAKNQLITSQLNERESSDGRALALGEAAVLLGNPNNVNTDLSKLQAVTAADVQRVMRKYFTSENRLVLHYLPEASKSTGGATK